MRHIDLTRTRADRIRISTPLGQITIHLRATDKRGRKFETIWTDPDTSTVDRPLVVRRGPGVARFVQLKTKRRRAR